MPKISKPNRPLADVNVLPRKDGSHSLANSYPYITYAEDGLRPAYRVSLSSKND